jgi:hypothetical protein
MYSTAYQEIADITLPVLKSYCEKHGYDWEIIRLPDHHWEFEKHEYLKEKMKWGIDVFFYLDVDALITNTEIKIESFLDDEHDLYLTHDGFELNGGSMIIKNTDIGKWANEVIINLKGAFPNEQNAINFLMQSPNFNQWVKVLPHPSINSFDYSLYPEFPDRRSREQGHWEEGCFVFHAPALSLDKRVEVLKSKIK